MRKLLTFMGIYIIPICLVFWALTYSPLAKPKIEVKPQGPDVSTVISASIMSIQAQSKLLVMTGNMNAIATSTMDKMGMSATQIDTAVNEAQYLVDLAKVTKENIKVTPTDLTLTLPRSALQLKLLPAIRKESYNNDSWLFTFSDETTKTLTRINQQKINQSLTQQGNGLKQQAETNARLSLTALLEAPLRASGFTQRVNVVFQ